MVEFYYDKIVQPDVNIHCDTKEKAKALLLWGKANGWLWGGGSDLSDTKWEDDKHETCYNFLTDKRVCRCSVGYLKRHTNETMLEYDDVVLGEEKDVVDSKDRKDDFYRAVAHDLTDVYREPNVTLRWLTNNVKRIIESRAGLYDANPLATALDNIPELMTRKDLDKVMEAIGNPTNAINRTQLPEIVNAGQQYATMQTDGWLRPIPELGDEAKQREHIWPLSRLPQQHEVTFKWHMDCSPGNPHTETKTFDGSVVEASVKAMAMRPNAEIIKVEEV